MKSIIRREMNEDYRGKYMQKYVHIYGQGS